MNVGQRYLFAVAPRQLDGDGSMVFETDGPAWRWLVGRGLTQPTLDGRRLPTDPDALLDVLRHRIEALPVTSTLVPSVPNPSLGPLLVLLSALAPVAPHLVAVVVPLTSGQPGDDLPAGPAVELGARTAYESTATSARSRREAERQSGQVDHAPGGGHALHIGVTSCGFVVARVSTL